MYLINGLRYIEFTEERFINCIMNQYVFFTKEKIDYHEIGLPETTFFELTFFKTKQEIQEVYDRIERELKGGITDRFAGHMIEDNAMEMTENHDNIKFVVLHELLN